MVYVLIALSLPFAGAFLMFALGGLSHNTRGFIATCIAFTAFLLILASASPVLNGHHQYASVQWFPQLEIALSFYFDGLALMFALLITGIGSLVCFYSIGYLHNEQIDVYYWFSLLLFMGSMLGVVLAADFVVLLVFWELTSITSFLLIGIEYWNFESRRGALNALFVTAGGGLCLLAGLLLSATQTGTFSIPEFLEMGIGQGPLATTAMILVLLGAFTKSAHFPFHFWLPQAMAAPTPISSYLHSATMVKAGIYLIIRLHPAFAAHALWSTIIMAMGLTTFLVGGIMAVSQDDMKALLAYSTISQLGMITFMLGISVEAAMVGAIFHILAHATFKGALFMGAGAIDHTLGTREMSEIGPLRKSMPTIAWVMGLCSLSMAGIIPFSGFVSKETMFKGLVKNFGLTTHWAVIGGVVASIFTFLYSMRFVIELPFNQAQEEETAGPDHSPSGLDKFSLTVPPVILCAGTIILGVGTWSYLGPVAEFINNFVNTAGHSMDHHFHYHFALWHGFGRPLQMTGVVVGVGLLLYFLLPVTRTFWREIARIPGPEDVNRVFQDNVVDVSHAIMDVLIRGPLSKYLRIMIGFTVLIGFASWYEYTTGLEVLTVLPQNPITYEWIPFVLVIAGGFGILKFDHPVPAVIALGSIGFLVSTIYLVFRAPDLILTQISVETVSIVIFLWVLKDINFPETKSNRFRGFDFLLSLTTAFGISYALLHTVNMNEGLSAPAKYFMEYSLPKAWGHNMVNVILVDFRALDTLGEISVIGIATVGILALLLVNFGRSTTGEVS